MSLQLDIALREIYFNVNGGYMSMEKLYQKAKKEGVPGVSRKNVKEWLQTQKTYIIHKPSRKHYKPQRTFVDGLAQQIQMDLVDMSKFSHKNKGNRWILTVIEVQGVSKKTLRKLNRLSCIINVAKQFNFYIGRKNSYLAFQ
jgi:hypothetical protein